MEPSVNDLIRYYKMSGITDYPKKKDGTPNMARVINKHNLNKLKNGNDLRDKEEPQHTEIECPICNEPINDMCQLKCKHKFCVSCAISHFRVKNNCPLCREIICSMPKTNKLIADEYVEAITHNVLTDLNIRRNMLSMKGYLLEKLVHYKRDNILNIERYLNDIQDELMNSIFDISDSISEWYVS